MLATGAFVDQRYQVVGLLGRGGMADVFKATDTATDRSVALKVLRGTEGTRVDRFHTEVAALSRLDHPGLVRLRGAGTYDGVPYLVLDLVEGPSLASELVDGPLGLERSLGIGVEVAEALTQTHRLGIVHRDVKPGNILLDASGHVRLADFGIARLADSARLTAVGAVAGSPAYVAPEQVEGQPGGVSADIYALGLVLLECLTGERCYPGGGVEAALARLYRPPTIPDDLPDWVRDVLVAMTARDPARRPSAAALVEAFVRRSSAAVVPDDQETGRLQLLTPTSETTVWTGRGAPSRLGASGRAALMVALLFVTLIAVWMAGDRTPPPATSSTSPTTTIPVTIPTTAPAVTTMPSPHVEPTPTADPSGSGEDTGHGRGHGKHKG